MNKIVTILSFIVFASFAVAGTASAQSAQVLKGRWHDSLGGSNTLEISFQDGWKTGRLELWCSRGLTRVDFVNADLQSSDRVYNVTKNSYPNSCGVDSFTIQPDGSGWRGDISASYQTTFKVK